MNVRLVLHLQIIVILAKGIELALHHAYALIIIMMMGLAICVHNVHI